MLTLVVDELLVLLAVDDVSEVLVEVESIDMLVIVVVEITVDVVLLLVDVLLLLVDAVLLLVEVLLLLVASEYEYTSPP